MAKMTTRKQTVELCTNILIDAKLKMKRDQKMEVTGRSPWKGESPQWTVVPLRRRREKNKNIPFLNSCCSLTSVLLECRWWCNLLWIAFWSTSEKNGNELCLQFIISYVICLVKWFYSCSFKMVRENTSTGWVRSNRTPTQYTPKFSLSWHSTAHATMYSGSVAIVSKIVRTWEP